MKTTVFTAMAAAALAAAIFAAGRCSRQGAEGGCVQVDTLIVRDTVRDTVLRAVERQRVRFDTVWVPIVSSKPAADEAIPALRGTELRADDPRRGSTLPDTIPVALPIERKVYRTADYRAVVEGFGAELTEMAIYRQTQIVTRTAQPKRWSVGLQAGVGITPKGLQPYIGAGVQWRLGR